MKLVRLDCDKSSFHSIHFKDGLNLVVGRKTNEDDKNTKNTYNGVGKSLIVYLIHFCLGSNKIVAFEKNIPGWNFELEFEIDNRKYRTRRNTTKQSEIYLNNEKYTLKKFREVMMELNFSIKGVYKNLTFNSLFPRFIRRDRESYNKFSQFVIKEQDYATVLNNSFLLGLDIDLVEEKKKLRDFQTNTEKLKKSLENDPVLKEHFSHKSDTEIEIIDLEEHINSLQEELNKFKIANNYDEIEKETDKLAVEIKKLSNERTLVNNDVINIRKSLELKPEISTDKIISFYNAVKVEVPEMVSKKVQESINFHNGLIDKRNQRLHKELKKSKLRLDGLEKEIILKGSLLDKNMGYLDTHGALEEYSSLNKMLNEEIQKLEKLKEYQKIMKSYNKKLLEIKTEYGSKSIETQEYIEYQKEWIESIKSLFRELTKEFYDKGSGIKIESNDGENTIRYNIDVRIQDDSSDGVNEVKIFCFDLMLLFLQANHNMKFIFHDSRLYSNMDPRQRGTVFKIVDKRMKDTEFQYIATVNEDQLTSFKELYTSDEYINIIEKNVILELTDESEASKLLGIQVDMKYEKN